MFGRISDEQRVALMLHCFAVGGGAGAVLLAALKRQDFRLARQFPAYGLRLAPKTGELYQKTDTECCVLFSPSVETQILRQTANPLQ